MHELDERLVELEIRHAHLERLCEELNEVVTNFGQRIVALERENGRLREMLVSLAPATPESPDE